MGKISLDEERFIREKVNKNRAFIAKLYPELAHRPDEMRKMVEAIDLLIVNWLKFRPETGEELKNFFAQQTVIVCNYYSQYVAVEFKEFCVYLEKMCPNGTAVFVDIRKNGKIELGIAHLLDWMIIRRNYFAAYLGDELKCFDDYYCPSDDSSVPEPS